MRTNLFNIVLLSFFLTICCGKISAQEFPKKTKRIATDKQETKPANPATQKETKMVTTVDTIRVDTLKKGKKYLEGKVKYKAKEYARFDQKKKLITLRDNAQLFYQDYELKAGVIVFDYNKREVYAGRLKDSTGKYYQYPEFKQGANVIKPDSIRFNYETKKALVWNSKTQQGDINVRAGISKKENDSVYFMKGARFTTSKNIDDPEYYFYTNKVKFVPGKKIVVGFTNMWIADVPTPVAMPFAFFPLTDKMRSGLLIPNWNYTDQRGYSLQNGGYYFALSDHYDLEILGDYYTNGSYGLRFQTHYAQRYKFMGVFNVRFENLINGERGFPGYSKNRIYNIQWSHTRDPKANPNSRFSASVNLGSSRYFQESINQINIGSNLNNTLNSSISYNKTINTVPQINLALTATHTQNTNNKSINMTLPTLTMNVDRVFPFSKDDRPKKGILQNINIRYDLTASNSYSTTDSLFFKSEMFKTAQTGFQHNIPLSTNFKVARYFNVSSSINYKEVWYLQTIRKKTNFESTDSQTLNERVNGFDAFRTYSFANSLSTTIYGTYGFKGNGRLKAIRHTMSPAVSYSYTPKFDQYYELYESARNYNRSLDPANPSYTSDYSYYTRFEGGIYGVPGLSDGNSLGVSLNNIFEGKVTEKDSTITEPKKVRLLILNFASGYDFKQKTWSTISFNGGTTFLKEKMTVNFGGSIDPYEYVKGSFVRSPFSVSNANLSMNYALASNTGKKEKKNLQGQRNGGRDDDLFGTNVDLSDRRDSQFQEGEEEKPVSFYNYDIPWDFNVAFTLNYTNADFGRKISSSSFMFSANSQITTKWKIGVSSGYDIVNKGFAQTQFRLERDLESWRMDFSWVPFGPYSSWGFFIGIKSGVLSDIKWDKRSLPDRTLR